MLTNITDYNVIYNGSILNAIEVDIRFNESFPLAGDIGEWRPDKLFVTALDVNNQIVVFADNASKFQFVRKVN